MTTLERALGAMVALAPAGTFVVGGAVRDRLLGATPHDVDIVTIGDALALARNVADSVGVAFMPLDAERGFGRVIGPDWVLDVTPLGRDDDVVAALHADLERRDFTFNAMALPLWAWLAGLETPLADPFGGAGHLRQRKLVLVSPTALQDDPVRALRALRFAARLDLRPAGPDFEAIRAAVALLPTVSAERVRDELGKLLGTSVVMPGMLAFWMRDLGILETLLPETWALRGVLQSLPHELDAFDHTIRVAVELDCLMLPSADDGTAAVRDPLEDWLDAPMEDGINRRALLRLAALLHDIGKARDAEWDAPNNRWTFHGHEDTGAKTVQETIVPRLRLGGRAAAFLGALVRHHMRPAHLERDGGSKRALARFFRETGDAAIGILLLAMADKLGKTRRMLPQQGRLTVLCGWLETALAPEAVRLTKPASPLDGTAIMRLGGIGPSPLVGQVKTRLADMYAAGEIETADEAAALVPTILAEFAK